MTAYTPRLFRSIPRAVSRRPSLTPSDDLLRDSPTSERGAGGGTWTSRPGSVQVRPPQSVRARPDPRPPSPIRAVAVPIGSRRVAVPRVLPGFSGSSQVHLSQM
nr:MAG TPA: hypothetical protein [Caudoviricetes sp.]